MPRLNERVRTPLPVEEAFSYLSDFANAAEWDPGTARSERMGDGSIGVGSRYRLGVRQGNRVADMEYRIVTYEPPHRVVLSGSGSGVRATDEIRFEADGDGSLVDYTADLNLTGPLRLIQPFLGGTFERIAADAAAGIERTLTERASRRTDR